MKDNKKRTTVVSIVIGVLAAIYMISPFDIINDALIGFGQVDDIAVAILAVIAEIVNYRLGRKKEVVYDEDGNPM